MNYMTDYASLLFTASLAPTPVVPALPSGWNSAAFACDEFNGAGVNEPVWPDLFDTVDVFPPTVLDERDFAIFDGCPDLSVRWESNTMVVPHEPNVMCVKR